MPDEIIKRHTIGISKNSLRARLEQKHNNKEKELTIKANRILWLLDLSSSMNEKDSGAPKIEHLRTAIQSFTEAMNPDDTSVCSVTFPTEGPIQQPTSDKMTLVLYKERLRTMGNTPLGAAMAKGLSMFSFTRGIIISDGQQTDGNVCFKVAADYAEAGVPLDCIHIGDSNKGEDTLQRIAEITHGLYIKFTNVSNFAHNFKYLTPGYRGLLESGNAAGLLGAKEVK